jgi:aarF domain-containing kinase
VWALATSGPTAIKFAQWVGTRPDLFPTSAVEALARFHGRSISKYPLEETVRDLDSIYGSDWNRWLELVDDGKLIGAGAIAHVCRGLIISGENAGKEVALKIAHRGVREIIEADLDIMNFGAWVVSLVPALTSLDIPGATEEFGKFMRAQTNLLTEADNINRFSVLFRERPDIKFPKVFLDHCTQDILVESFENGIPLYDVIEKGSVNLKKRVCDIGVDAFLKMLFVDNFIHADLHPGNIFIQPSNTDDRTSYEFRNDVSRDIGGKVVLIDCGLIAQLSRKDERNFLDLMHAVITGKSEQVGRLMIERSKSPPETVYRPDEFCEKVAKLVETTVTGKTLLFGGIEFGAVITQLLNIARQHKVRLETDFVSVACALIVLEGVGKQLDPNRNLLWEAEPYILRQFLRRAKEAVSSLY